MYKSIIKLIGIFFLSSDICIAEKMLIEHSKYAILLIKQSNISKHFFIVKFDLLKWVYQSMHFNFNINS